MIDQAAKTRELQKQFICPIWTVWFGESVKVYFTHYHAEQMISALHLNCTTSHGYDGHGNAI